LQTAPEGQRIPHAPQLSALVARLTQMADPPASRLQSIVPAGQVKSPSPGDAIPPSFGVAIWTSANIVAPSSPGIGVLPSLVIDGTPAEARGSQPPAASKRQMATCRISIGG